MDPLLGAALISGGSGIASGLIGKFLGGGDEMSQVPMETPEQKAARGMLLNFAQTGKFGNFTAGEEVPLKYGDYQMTDLQRQGQMGLQGLLQGGIPEQFRLGNEALRQYLSTDPRDVQAMFQPFADQTDRMTREASAGLKRGAAAMGGLYSTDTVRGLGDVESRGLQTKTAELARLTDQALQRRLSAVPMAYQAGQAEQAAKMQQIQAAYEYGDLARSLNDASIKARDAELLRRRGELTMPIDAARTVAGSQTQFGVPSVQGPSPYQGLLNTAAGAASQWANMNAFRSIFQPQVQQPKPTPQYEAGLGMPLWK